MRVERVVLEDHRDVSVAWQLVRDIAPTDFDGATRDFLQSCDHAKRCALAASRWTDENDKLTIGNSQRALLDRSDATAIDLGDIREADQCHLP